MDEKEAEARPGMGTIFLVYIRDSRLNRPESVSLASLARFTRSPIIIIIRFFRRVFSECTEAIATSLIH